MTGFRTAVVASAFLACAMSQPQANAALLLGSDGATVYDTVHNVTWLANFNLPAANRFGLPLCNGIVDTKGCVNASGTMSFQAASAWVAAMNAANYLGHSNWQLPTTALLDTSCSFVGPQNNSFGWGCSGGALGSLYYVGLALAAPDTAVPIPANTVGPFSNFQPYIYWSQSSNAQNGTGFSTFSFASGYVGSNTAPNYIYALPMIAGKLPGTPAASGTGLQVNPGGQTVYDPVANVTWLANANIAATNAFGLPSCSGVGNPHICVNADGAMNSDSAAQFIANMNAYNGTGYLGVKGWELPPMSAGCAQYDCGGPGNPMGELFYGQLGLAAGASVVAPSATYVGPFNHMQPYLYWSCQGPAIGQACDGTTPAPGFQWSFSFGNGFLGTDVIANDLNVTAYYLGPPPALKANYEGLWWKSPAGSESGWGVNITHQGDILFATWFTYDTDGSGLWLVMPDGAKTGDATFTGTLYRTTGPAFSSASWNASQVVATPVGTATFTFNDANNGTFAYVVNGVAQSKAITRQVFSATPTCVEGGITGASPNYEDLWWDSPAGSESGWGVNITHQGDVLFATWFTYDAAGKGLWLVMSNGNKTAPGVYSGDLYRTTGPAFSANPWNPSQVSASRVGSATFTFGDANHGTFAYTVNGVAQSKSITRQVYAMPTTVCD